MMVTAWRSLVERLFPRPIGPDPAKQRAIERAGSWREAERLGLEARQRRAAETLSLEARIIEDRDEASPPAPSRNNGTQ